MKLKDITKILDSEVNFRIHILTKSGSWKATVGDGWKHHYAGLKVIRIENDYHKPPRGILICVEEASE